MTTVLNPHPVRRSFLSPSLGIILIHLVFLLFARGNIHTLFGFLGLAISLYIHFTGKMTARSWYDLLPFAILFLPFVALLKIAFLAVDQTTAVTIAWVTFCGLQLYRGVLPEHFQKSDARLTWGVLFTIWSAFFWLILIWEVGTWRIADFQKDRLGSVIFPIWETNPVSKHLFLGYLRMDDLDHGRAYGGHSPFYLLITYLYTKAVQYILGVVEIQRAARLLPFLSLFAFVLLALFILKHARNRLFSLKPGEIIFAFLGLGYLLSDPALIIGSWHFNADNTFPVSIYLIVMISLFLLNNDYESKVLPILVIVFSLISPINACLFLLITPFFVWRSVSSERVQLRRYIKLLALGFSVAVVTFLIPVLCIKLAGYENLSTSYLVRSGLDGDTTRYQNIIQAVISPWGMRPWSIWPPILLFLSVFAWMWKSGNTRTREMLQKGSFLLSFYAINIALFPQSISVHPYLYDYLFMFPMIALSLVYFLAQLNQIETKGPVLFGCGLILFALILYNLTLISQSARSLPL